MKFNSVACVGFLSALAFTCVAATAGAFECTGVDVLVNKFAETTELPDGHSLLVVRNDSVVITNDADNIFNMTTGECSGTILFTPDGAAESSGHCARKDKDGDTYSIRWGQDAGADKGSWAFVTGTGKFKGQAGNSGWFQAVVTDGAMSVSTWGGSCQ